MTSNICTPQTGRTLSRRWPSSTTTTYTSKWINGVGTRSDRCSDSSRRGPVSGLDRIRWKHGWNGKGRRRQRKWVVKDKDSRQGGTVKGRRGSESSVREKRFVGNVQPIRPEISTTKYKRMTRWVLLRRVRQLVNIPSTIIKRVYFLPLHRIIPSLMSTCFLSNSKNRSHRFLYSRQNPHNSNSRDRIVHGSNHRSPVRLDHQSLFYSCFRPRPITTLDGSWHTPHDSPSLDSTSEEISIPKTDVLERRKDLERLWLSMSSVTTFTDGRWEVLRYKWTKDESFLCLSTWGIFVFCGETNTLGTLFIRKKRRTTDSILAVSGLFRQSLTRDSRNPPCRTTSQTTSPLSVPTPVADLHVYGYTNNVGHTSL